MLTDSTCRFRGWKRARFVHPIFSIILISLIFTSTGYQLEGQVASIGQTLVSKAPDGSQHTLANIQDLLDQTITAELGVPTLSGSANGIEYHRYPQTLNGLKVYGGAAIAMVENGELLKVVNQTKTINGFEKINAQFMKEYTTQ